MSLPPQVPRSKATTVAASSAPLAFDWLGPTYSLIPVATAWAPPHDFHTTCVTRPVGAPPLKILDGLTCPNPWPRAKTPVGRPSGGTAAAGLVEAVTDGEDVVAGLGLVVRAGGEGPASRPGVGPAVAGAAHGRAAAQPPVAGEPPRGPGPGIP